MHSLSVIFVAVVFVGCTIAKIPAVAVDLSEQCNKEGEYFPDRTNCQAFYECINGEKKHNICPDPLLWNVHIPGCSINSDCSQVSTSTTAAYCEDGDLTDDPANCNIFFICEGHRWIGPYNCPKDLYWSEKTKGCVQRQDSDCYCTPGNRWADPNDCSLFYECDSDGKLQHWPCPMGLFFNSTSNVCDEYENVECTCKPHQYWPYHGDCTRFFVCNGSKISVAQCPKDFFFDDQQNICDRHENVHCYSKLFQFWPDPKDCAKYYVYNQDNKITHLECPKGLFFSNMANLCGAPETVNCPWNSD
uniref:Peritrophin-48-like isoform X2 n=1 Tax=Diabrotica virgifera virgifera TaxID=50390 RepID=A0A6P7G5P0_DIAVI